MSDYLLLLQGIGAGCDYTDTAFHIDCNKTWYWLKVDNMKDAVIKARKQVANYGGELGRAHRTRSNIKLAVIMEISNREELDPGEVSATHRKTEQEKQQAADTQEFLRLAKKLKIKVQDAN